MEIKELRRNVDILSQAELLLYLLLFCQMKLMLLSLHIRYYNTFYAKSITKRMSKFIANCADRQNWLQVPDPVFTI